MRPPTLRVQLRVTGTVQGVGFRPFVYRHAVALGLTGTVGNDSAGVLIEAEGPAPSLVELQRLLTADAPPLARVDAVVAVPLAPRGGTMFRIVESADLGAPDAPVAVDAATCDDCLRELFDPADRRYRYPFVNCTNCGPRYTIVRSVPYDRAATTMAAFTMCDACRREYDDPADRRFHAEPNACAACGPTVRLVGADGAELGGPDDAIDAAAALLTDGGIVAVKGLGGFHLACDATDDAAVAELRRRKARDDKPFAVMVPDLATALTLCALDDDAEAALTSPRRPIVLAAKANRVGVAEGAAPGLAELGLLLPYTPVHHLLLAAVGRPLVMTSGNISDEPIAHTDDDARARLGDLADAFLVHDRAIHIRCDDSVVRGGVQVLRRSRGYAPEPRALPIAATRPILAVGAELKSTVSVAKDAHVVTSHHLGDLEHLAAYLSFRQAAAHLQDVFGVDPGVVAHDLHPEYLSTKFALDLDLPTVAVQHHHAHIAACMAEHSRTERVLGIAFDGLGMGDDGTLWGGEFLVCDLTGYRRVGHLRTVPLPGGSAAIHEPWRMAVAWAHAAAGPELAARVAASMQPDHPDRGSAVLDLVSRGQGRATSSVGRLFDAVAAHLGLRARVSYEGQAAIELEALAAQAHADDGGTYDYAIDVRARDEPVTLDPAPMIVEILDDIARGTSPKSVARRFHDTLAAATAESGERLAAANSCDTIALSGGVFQNALLSRAVADELAARGLRVLSHRDVPCNDGGVSVGQAAVAAATDRLGPSADW